jgi:hypothetical protein
LDFVKCFLERFLCTLPIVDLDTRSVPHHGVPLIIPLGNVSMQKPEILSVGTPHASFVLEHFSAGTASLPPCQHSI